jgi:hypothetical protein
MLTDAEKARLKRMAELAVRDEDRKRRPAHSRRHKPGRGGVVSCRPLISLNDYEQS